MRPPDLVLYGGPIVTMDPVQPQAQALVIRGEQILAVGSEAEIRATAAPGYQTIDLAGRTAVPGLCDAHLHLLLTAKAASQVKLDGVQSYTAALDLIAAHAAALPAHAWVLGHGWDHSLWGDRWPTAHELDQVTGGRPAILSRKDAHSVWCSTAALAQAGITAATSDPVGGSIQRDATGAATGIVLETAQDLIWPLVDAPTAAENEQALAGLLRGCLAAGITSVHAPEGVECLRAVQALYGRGTLGLRVLHHLRVEQLEHALALGLQSGLGDHWLRIGGVKIFSDGSLGSGTAHMLEPFDSITSAQCCGIPTLPGELLGQTIEQAIAGRISVAVHAIGDAANRAVLDGIEAALRAYPERLTRTGGPIQRRAGLPCLPHRIEHAQLVHPDDLARFAQLGVVASMQPIHATSDMDLAERLWGRRCSSAYAWRTLLDLGTILAFGSDAPVETWNPWAGIHAAVTRQQRDGQPVGGWYPEQRLSLEEALWAYTVGPALASGELAIKGTLTPGKLADLSILDRDLAQTRPDELHAIQAAVTVVGGAVVWERDL